MNSTSTIDPTADEEPMSTESDPVRPAGSVAPAAAGAGGGESISKDDLFHLLRNSRRRAVVQYLRGREGPVRMRDVAEQVAAWEHDTTVSGLGSDERQRVYVALYQSHLDTLADAGVIEYDKSRGVIDPRPLLDRVAAYTDRPVPNGGVGSGPAASGVAVGEWERTDRGADTDDRGPSDTRREEHGRDRDDERGDAGARWNHRSDPWSRGYLGASVAGAGLLTGTALDVAVLQALPGVVAGFLVLAVFSALTVAKLCLDDGGRTADPGA